MPIGRYVSVITLNVNGLIAPTKRHRMTEWIQKQDQYTHNYSDFGITLMLIERTNSKKTSKDAVK